MADTDDVKTLTDTRIYEVAEVRLQVPDDGGAYPGSDAVDSPRVFGFNGASGLSGLAAGSLILDSQGEHYKVNSSGAPVLVDAGLTANLASTSNGAGASLVGVEDSSGFYSVATVEAVLAAIGPFIPVEIADPGDAGAIPVTQAGDCQLTSAGAETRTLADPTQVGQILTLRCVTYVGDIIVTAASPINATGNNTLTFGVAGDEIILIGARDAAAAYAWHVLNNDGVALSTV